MSAKYGDLFSLRLGMRERVVYVVDPEIMKQVFLKIFFFGGGGVCLTHNCLNKYFKVSVVNDIYHRNSVD